MKVDLNAYPAYTATGRVSFPKLDGGLNLRELDYRLEANQSPAMKNLWWQDGVLQCRDGQRWLSGDASRGTGHACAPTLFRDCAFFHIGDTLWWADMAEIEARARSEPELALNALLSGVPENRGTFFRYNGDLYYKNRGGFYRISHRPETPETPFSAADMTDGTEAYTPVIVINASPENGGGDLYQPENRLSPRKEVRYNAADGVTVYHLPAADVDAVVRVAVDGAELTEGADYTVQAEAGTVTFAAAPPVTVPPTNNTVEIVYSKQNPDALASLMDCPYATTAGNGNRLCILLGGAEAQPNAVFWNGNDSLGMHPGYFPMGFYNLCGDASDGVTGFGMQYSDLILFKERSVGKLGFSVERVDGRDSISFTYQSINARIGCDLPWSIQLVENNLVFCNRMRGVHIIRSSSAALENNIACISENVNGAEYGLLADVRAADRVSSADDDSRYWLCAGGHVYLWDYSLSSADRPAWFYFTEVNGIGYFADNARRLYHLDAAGRVTCFERQFSDYPRYEDGEYAGAIEKSYAFPTQYFGDYDRLKDILYLLVAVRSDTDTEVTLRYETDHEKREDLTPIRSYAWRLSPRNLSRRCLAVPRFGHVEKRRPGCRHVRHFSMTLENNIPGEDLAIVSAQVYYRYQGKER